MSALVPGHVVLLDDTQIGHPKDFLVAGIPENGEGPLLFMISSHPSLFVQIRDHLWPYQIKVDKDRHPFMPKEESWLNCREVRSDHTWVSIDYMLRKQLGRVCGMIDDEVKAQVITAVKNTMNEGISKKQREIILASLLADN